MLRNGLGWGLNPKSGVLKLVLLNPGIMGAIPAPAGVDVDENRTNTHLYHLYDEH